MPGASSRRYDTPVAASTVRVSISTSPPRCTAWIGPRVSRRDDVAGKHHLRAEAPGLRDGAVREIGAGQTFGEPEVVLDRCALARLAAGRFPLDDDGLQAFGRAVDGRRESRRAHRRRCRGRTAVARRASAGRARRPDRASTARATADRREPTRAGGRWARGRGVVQPDCFVVALEIEPLVWHVVAREERLDLVGSVRPPMADDSQDAVRRGVRFAPVAQQVVERRGTGAPRADPKASSK